MSLKEDMKLKDESLIINASQYAYNDFDSKNSYKNLSKMKKSLGLGEKYRDKEYKRWHIEEAFMSMAYVLSKCSHDANTQHGCIIVDENNHIVSSGFNGFLPGAPDNILPNIRDEGHKYKFVIHAEANACAHATRSSLKGCRVFVTGYPCNECLKTMINKGIRDITVGDVGHVVGDDFWELHHFLVKVHGVTIRKFNAKIVDPSLTREMNFKKEE